MATSLVKATYAEIIDDLRSDANEGARLSLLPDRAIQKWILDAQEKVCDLVQVDESYSIGLNDGVVDYPFQERPAISGATNASPIVVTATAHGLTDNDRIFVSGVLGNTAANGAFQIYSSSTNAFSIRAVVDISGASYETPIEITADAHGFSTGDSITVSSVTGNTAANGTWTITVVDVNNFTLDTSVGTASYLGGGIATKVTTGSGAYTSGGRFWRDDEIPTHLNRITAIRRPWGEYFKPLRVVNIDYLLEQEKRDTDSSVAYSATEAPVMAAEFMKMGQRYLRFYPEPYEDKTAIIYGSMVPSPRAYTDDPLTTTVLLPHQYEGLIRSYCRMKLYAWLKDEKRESKFEAEFYRLMGEFRLRKQTYPRLEVVI